MESLNRMALGLVEEAVEFADELGIAAYELDDGATVLDFGHEATGGIEAGLLLAEIQTAGLATVETRLGAVADTPRTHVELTTDRPALALLCAGKAGWELSVEGFEGLGSGPARALVAEEDAFRRIGYHESAEFATLAVEAERLPGDAVAEHVAELAGVEPTAVFLPAFPTGSLVGSVTVAARAAELAVFRLSELGYDPLDVRSASASAPVAPVSRTEGTAIGRTNDALAYGGRVHLTVAEGFDRFEELPSTAATEYGTPLGEVFEERDWEVADVPAAVFAPARVTVDVIDGSTHVLGGRDEALLAESFDLPVP
ncbi:methenyltetrahydromethanopterin cyclohydrolase [Halobacteriales archaeon QS_4_69_34]|nr:MAG: methenyltetrahydromethanopterin cyclohydrolase [Halobacteriales archaeon QS_4_69_34]